MSDTKLIEGVGARQYKMVSQMGLLGACLEGAFDSSEASSIENPFIKQALAQQLMMNGGVEVFFDPVSGNPVSASDSPYMNSMFQVYYKLPVNAPEGTEKIVKFRAPSYIKGAKCGYVDASDGGWSSKEQSPSGNIPTAVYTDAECTKYLDWYKDPYSGNNYFIMPEFIWFKLVAQEGGSFEWQDSTGTGVGYSRLRVSLNYGSKSSDIEIFE